MTTRSNRADKASSRRPSAARERILRTVDRLFYEEGIRAVGVHRVVDESAVTRVTLYRHFRSKDDLVGAYLVDRAERAQSETSEILDAHAGDPRAALSALGSTAATVGLDAEPRGCTFINAAAEFADPDHPARLAVTRQRAWILAVLERLLADLGAPDPRRTARQLVMLRTGAVFGAALDDSADLDEDFLDAWEAIVDAAAVAAP